MTDNKEHIVLVLQLVNCNGDTSFLLNLGYDYVDIAKFINALRQKKYLDFSRGRLVLTNTGKQYIEELNAHLKRKNIEKYISPLIQYRVEQSDKFEVYLPVFKKIKVERE